jgi:hypothetical protein
LIIALGVAVAASVGGPGSIGATRPLLLAVAAAAGVVTVCPPVRRSTATVCAGAAAVVGVVVGFEPGGLPEMLPGLALYNPRGVFFDSGYFGVSSLALHLALAGVVMIAIVASQIWPRLAGC